MSDDDPKPTRVLVTTPRTGGPWVDGCGMMRCPRCGGYAYHDGRSWYCAETVLDTSAVPSTQHKCGWRETT